jgi:hypothetical protein
MAKHKDFTVATDAGVLLRSASAESLAARYERKHQLLLRQYFPRGIDLSAIRFNGASQRNFGIPDSCE